MISKTDIFVMLLQKQLKNIEPSKRFKYNDLKRVAKKITLETDGCYLWTGYITNAHKSSKGLYINFYFRHKKWVLHRLLYTNLKGELKDDEYIKFTCENHGKCCNVNHMLKFSYEREIKDISIKPEPEIKKVIMKTFEEESDFFIDITS